MRRAKDDYEDKAMATRQPSTPTPPSQPTDTSKPVPAGPAVDVRPSERELAEEAAEGKPRPSERELAEETAERIEEQQEEAEKVKESEAP
jgi:hypothetical protein